MSKKGAKIKILEGMAYELQALPGLSDEGELRFRGIGANYDREAISAFSSGYFPRSNTLSPGTLVEVKHYDAQVVTKHLIVRTPKVAEAAGIGPRRLGDYYIVFRDCHTISDLELLDREEHVIGPCNNRTYMIPWSDDSTLQGRIKFVGSPYMATEIPLGTVGMVLKPLRVSPNYTFFDGCSLCSTQKALLSVTPSHKVDYNYYLVYCTEQLDAHKSGYYLLPIDSVKPFESTRSIGINNFHIYAVHSNKRMFE